MNVYKFGSNNDSYSYARPQNCPLSSSSLFVRMVGDFYCNETYYTDRTNYGQHLMLYTLEGEGVLRYKNKEYSLTPNTVFIIDCDDYQYYATAKDYWHFYFAHFAGESAKELTDLFSDGETYCRKIVDSATFSQNFFALLRCGENSSASEVLRSSILLNQLFLQAITEKNASSYPDNATKIVQQAIDIIKRSYAEKITLDTLAKATFTSKYYFLRLFRKVTGATPGEYLLSYRINRAQALLKTTHLSVEEIATAVGYENTSAFVRAFTSLVGITPRKYKFL